MDLGLPVVGTKIPGIVEAVGFENMEFLSESKDYESMARNIIRFAIEEDLIKKIGLINQKRINEHFSLKRMCDEHWDLINLNIKN